MLFDLKSSNQDFVYARTASVAALLVKHIKSDYVTEGNLLQLCDVAQKFESDLLGEMCANFILKENIALGWKEVEKIPIVTAIIHQQLMEKEASLEVTVVPKAGKGKPATRRLTNRLIMMKEHVLKPIWEHQLAWPFEDPVDTIKLGIPDYFDIIRRPMDLGTIRERFENDFYRSSKEAMADFAQVFANCYKYNNPEYEIVAMGKELERFFLSRMAKLPEEEFALHEKDLDTNEDNLDESEDSDEEF